MAKCSFCGENIEPGTGNIFVLKEGKALTFCGMKCEKNMIKLGRKAIRTKWTSKYTKFGEAKE